MKAYIYFSVYEALFQRIARRLRDWGVDEYCGFVWSKFQADAISDGNVSYDPLVVFTRDLLPRYEAGGSADLEWLARRERELGVSISRMLASERHLLQGRDHGQQMKMAEIALKEIAATLDRTKPDFVLSTDISCFHSYAHFVLARERGIPFWCITTGRLPKRIAVYSRGLMHWDRVEDLYPRLLARGLDPRERAEAEGYVTAFRDRPVRPTGMNVRAAKPRVELADLGRVANVFRRYTSDPHDPTMRSTSEVVRQRLRRLTRTALTKRLEIFEKPVAGEKYVLYPLHFQPEASTLVLAPMYVDQLALLDDIAKSLPIGHRLYVKEHVSSTGRRPIEYYRALRRIPAVRLLGPDVDTWSLIRDASALAVITGTMGWEGLLFGKPVISFGDVFYNLLPHVHRASQVPKDGWHALFRRAIEHHAPDHDALLALVSAIHQSSHPGFIASPTTFPDVLDDDNITKLVQAVATEVGLRPSALSNPAAQAR